MMETLDVLAYSIRNNMSMGVIYSLLDHAEDIRRQEEESIPGFPNLKRIMDLGRPSSMFPDVEVYDDFDMREYIENGFDRLDKVHSIKQLRMRTGMSLKTSKGMVEQIMRMA